MAIDRALLDIQEYAGPGYAPIVDYGAWRVAVLRFCDDVRVENTGRMERHDESDEVFVLLAGRCVLQIGAGNDRITEVYAEELLSLRAYNVKRGVWHSATLTPDATVLIIENRDTSDDNSQLTYLDAGQRARLIAMTRALWDR